MVRKSLINFTLSVQSSSVNYWINAVVCVVVMDRGCGGMEQNLRPMSVGVIDQSQVSVYS